MSEIPPALLPIIADLRAADRQNADGLAELRRSLTELGTSVAALESKIDATATKADIERAINGILGKALDSVPARQMVGWTIVLAVAAIAMPLLVALMMHGH